MFYRLKTSIRNIFIAGLLVILPIGITVFVLFFLFNKLDHLLSPIVVKFLHKSIPGVGVIVTFILIFVVGLFTKNVVGRKLIGFGEYIFSKIPVAREVYTAAKQFLDALQRKKELRSVVLVEFPRKGIYSIGFITCDASNKIQEILDKKLVNIFIPTTPNPTSGYLIMVPREELIYLPISIEDGIKLIISAGIVKPSEE